ncbi:MAG: hypothetical protein EBZ60_03895 [Betaproteobacteria bacterium]|nr:hypothetical protein [Betaproteobacteria bacterium]
MRRSFRFRLTLQFVFCILLVTLLNRFFSQYFANAYVQERIEIGMVKVLQRCGDLYKIGTGAHECSEEVRAPSWMESLPQSYVFCDEGGGQTASQSLGLCLKSSQTSTVWHDVHDPQYPGFESSRFEWQAQGWHAVRQSSTGRMLLVSQVVMDRFIDELWGIRNRVMQYVFPVIVLMLLMVSWFMTRVMLKPLNNIQDSLENLSSKNLHEPLVVSSDFKEFEPFTLVFEQLRGRLHNSFLQSQRFAADASHELRTPLTILRGHAEMGIAGLPAGSEAQIRMRLMGEEIERLIDITEKLLLLSQADANNIKPDLVDLNLSDLINQYADDAKLYQAKFSISRDIQPNLIWRCDKQLVNQLIQNIYVNAIHYNLPDGWLDFKLHRVGESFELILSNPTQGAVADLSGRAFERFYRGDSAHTRQVDGHGLGLSLCIEIVHLHHGQITLRADEHQVVHVSIMAPLLPPNTWVD